MTKLIQHIVSNCPEPMRLDRYLRLNFSGLTQGAIEKYIRKKQIKLNSLKTESSVRIKDGDILDLRIQLEDNYLDIFKNHSPGAKALAQKISNEYLIDENEHFLVINKPSGVASQSGTNVALSINDAINYLNEISDINDNINIGLRLVHRLDKDTSGVFLIAKNRVVATKLGDGFKNKIIHKQYLAIVDGAPAKSKGIISNYLTKDSFEKIQKVSDQGDYAETEYQVIYNNNNFSLILFTPKTGRMHQIRVHAKELGCPIVGDQKYGIGSQKDQLMLHAYKICIPKAIFDKEMNYQAKLPPTFYDYIRKNSSSDLTKLLGEL